jgi:GNAT superfamily N-acetyltransferase
MHFRLVKTVLKVWKVIPLRRGDEEKFLIFVNKNKILHVFTIYDLRNMRDRTPIWVAYENDEIRGYVFEFDRRIVHTHGTPGSMRRLLAYIDLDEPVFIIEPEHLAVIERFFESIGPTDAASQGKVTRYLVMKANSREFRPVIRHETRKLAMGDVSNALNDLGEERAKRVQEAVQTGMAYGAYEEGKLASVATVPEIIGNIAFIRGVYTDPALRGRRLSTSAVSTLVAELFALGKEPVLWVAEDNFPAKHVYEKIGFKKTKHVLLGFKARRL